MKNVNVTDYGAAGDGRTLDTHAIQEAIDDCGRCGGGRVTLKGGIFLSGTLYLHTGVDLHLENDAVLLASPEGDDYDEFEPKSWNREYAPRHSTKCLIYAEECSSIAITGRGCIDCNGQHYVEKLSKEEAQKSIWQYRRKGSNSPARIVMFIHCTDVCIYDITMKNQPACWSYWICGCMRVQFSRIKIDAPLQYPNNDGIHINCCSNVTISDCMISSGDDAIVIRAYSLPLGKDTVCEKVTVTNCTITTYACAVRLGWINDGVIKNCTISNLTCTNCHLGLVMSLPPNDSSTRMDDQGEEYTHIENISFCNIILDRHFYEPIVILVGEHNLAKSINNIYFSNIIARSGRMPIIWGKESCRVKNVYFNNCHFEQIDRTEIPNEAEGPHRMHLTEGILPYFQHVDNLVMQGTVFTVR